MTSIFDYTDYREFLKTFYRKKKTVDSNFSYGVLAKRSNISSRGLLKLIMDGKRNLSLSKVGGLTAGLGLNKAECDYFFTMVQLNQAKGSVEKHKFFEKLMRFPQKRRMSDLKREQYNLYANWYFCVLYELILFKKKEQSFEEFCIWVAQKMKGRLTQKEVKSTYKELFSLGLLKEEEGVIKQTSTFLESNGREEVNFAIQNFHREMMELAVGALEQPIEKRAYGAVTLAIRHCDIPKAKDFIRDFRNKFNVEFSANTGADSVYQLNVQFFELVDAVTPDPNLDPNSTKDKQNLENSVPHDGNTI